MNCAAKRLQASDRIPGRLVWWNGFARSSDMVGQDTQREHDRNRLCVLKRLGPRAATPRA
jgi:hypothetical protein